MFDTMLAPHSVRKLDTTLALFVSSITFQNDSPKVKHLLLKILPK